VDFAMQKCIKIYLKSHKAGGTSTFKGLGVGIYGLVGCLKLAKGRLKHHSFLTNCCK